VEILGVLDQRQIERPGVLERAAQQARVHHRAAVVGDRDDAALFHVGDIGQHLALEALGDRADRPDPDGAELAGAPHDQLGHRALVVDRLGVRHAADRREATGGRRARAGLDVFLVFLAGLAQVDVEIDEAGDDPQALDVDDAAADQAAADLDDPALRDPDIGDLIDGTRGAGVEHPTAAEHEIAGIHR
jgi:hypothetical protein